MPRMFTQDEYSLSHVRHLSDGTTEARSQHFIVEPTEAFDELANDPACSQVCLTRNGRLIKSAKCDGVAPEPVVTAADMGPGFLPAYMCDSVADGGYGFYLRKGGSH
jgi:hypothetical protein